MTRERPERPTTDYPVVERDDAPIRAYRDHVKRTCATAAGWWTCAAPRSTRAS